MEIESNYYSDHGNTVSYNSSGEGKSSSSGSKGNEKQQSDQDQELFKRWIRENSEDWNGLSDQGKKLFASLLGCNIEGGKLDPGEQQELYTIFLKDILLHVRRSNRNRDEEKNMLKALRQLDTRFNGLVDLYLIRFSKFGKTEFKENREDYCSFMKWLWEEVIPLKSEKERLDVIKKTCTKNEYFEKMINGLWGSDTKDVGVISFLPLDASDDGLKS